jgi:hypothetical protein
MEVNGNFQMCIASIKASPERKHKNSCRPASEFEHGKMPYVSSQAATIGSGSGLCAESEFPEAFDWIESNLRLVPIDACSPARFVLNQ